MAKRQRRTPGSILEINLNNGFYGYAQIINEDILFFDIYISEKLSDYSVLNEKDPLFFLSVFDYVITKGEWEIVGKLPIKEEYQIVPLQFIQDSLNLAIVDLYNPNTGKITRSSKEEVAGLECAAVWEGGHVEDRLRDHYEGKENIWLEQTRIK